MIVVECARAMGCKTVAQIDVDDIEWTKVSGSILSQRTLVREKTEIVCDDIRKRVYSRHFQYLVE